MCSLIHVSYSAVVKENKALRNSLPSSDWKWMNFSSLDSPNWDESNGGQFMSLGAMDNDI